MAMKKGLLIGFMVVALVGGLCIGGCGFLIYWAVSSAKEFHSTADQFLTQISQGNESEAYESAAQGLRSRMTREQFSTWARQLKLNDYAAVGWNSFNVTQNNATLDGTMTTKQGDAIPIRVTLLKEDGVWRVLNIENMQAAAAKPTVPADEELRQLVTTTLLAFNKAALSGDFKEFHQQTSVQFRQQKTPAELSEAFKAFTEQKIDISNIKDVKSVFNAPPTIGANDVLDVKGYYPTKPSQVKFELQYVYEHPNWKLLAISVEVTQ